jgi:hypothetical protein
MCAFVSCSTIETILLIPQQEHNAKMLSRQQLASPGCVPFPVGRL